MKSINDIINESYFDQGGNVIDKEKELIKKFLGPYASKVSLKQSITNQRFNKKLTSGWYEYYAQNRDDVKKFSGYLYDLYKDVDDNLPDNTKGNYFYIKLKNGVTKEEFVDAKLELYDNQYSWYKKMLKDPRRSESFKKDIAAAADDPHYNITFSLN